MNKIPLTLEVLEHLRTHIENLGSDFCYLDIEISKTLSGRTAIKFKDKENGVIIEQHFSKDDLDDMSDEDISLHIKLLRRNFPI